MRSRPSSLLILLLGVAAAVPAFAQTAPPGATTNASVYPSCENKTPTHDDSEAAHAAFLLGKRKYDEADYPSALVYFKDAYKTDCTKHDLLPIIAAAFERHGDKGEAVNALEVYLKRSPGAADTDVQTKRISNLKAQIAEQQKAAASAAPTTTATPAGKPTTAPAGDGGGHTLAPWIVVGVGGAMLVTGVIVLAVGAGKVSDVNTQCPNTVCKAGGSLTPAQAHDQDQSGKTLQGVGGVIGGLGLAAVAGGLVWHFLEKPSSKEAAATAFRLQPSVSPGYAGASFGGRF